MCDQLQYLESMVWGGRVRWKMGSRERVVEKGVGGGGWIRDRAM